MEQRDAERRQSLQLFGIVLFAIIVRLIYQAAMISFGGSFHNGSDSGKYISAAQELIASGQWPSTDRLPGYILFIAAIFKAAGGEALRTVVTVQAVLDGFSVLAIALTARSLSSRLTIPAALIAAVLPNFIAHSSYILQETLFTVVFTWGLCSLFYSMRSSRPATLLIIAGLLFGATLWIRLTLIYYAIVLIPVLAVALKLGGPRTWIQATSYALVPAATIALAISPLLTYNYFTYHHAELSPQTGDHLLRWFYACLATPWPCSDRVAVLAKLEPIIRAYSESAANEYELSIMQKRLAVTSIMQLPLWQVAWGMIWGAFRNLFQTSFYFVIGQFNQPETFISAMPGSNLLERIAAFVSANYRSPFMVMWVISQATLLLSRLVQGAGALVGLRQVQFRGQTILLLATIIYVLALNGPIANPKYRIPCEPALILLTALGWVYSPFLAKWRARLCPQSKR